jgi:hypothetical protein
MEYYARSHLEHLRSTLKNYYQVLLHTYRWVYITTKEEYQVRQDLLMSLLQSLSIKLAVMARAANRDTRYQSFLALIIHISFL